MRFAAGFLFGVFLAGALLPVGVLVGAALIGLGLGTLWARRRSRTRPAPCSVCGHEPVNCPGPVDYRSWCLEHETQEDHFYTDSCRFVVPEADNHRAVD